jgi:hypothetical protein
MKISWIFSRFKMRMSATKTPAVIAPSAIIIILKIFPRKYDAQRHKTNAKQPSASGRSLNKLIISPPLLKSITCALLFQQFSTKIKKKIPLAEARGIYLSNFN